MKLGCCCCCVDAPVLSVHFNVVNVRYVKKMEIKRKRESDVRRRRSRVCRGGDRKKRPETKRHRKKRARVGVADFAFFFSSSLISPPFHLPPF
jgi:aspartate-semialdehyde dehydrogenase